MRTTGYYSNVCSDVAEESPKWVPYIVKEKPKPWLHNSGWFPE
jgi:hypothetical protein